MKQCRFCKGSRYLYKPHCGKPDCKEKYDALLKESFKKSQKKKEDLIRQVYKMQPKEVTENIEKVNPRLRELALEEMRLLKRLDDAVSELRQAIKEFRS